MKPSVRSPWKASSIFSLCINSSGDRYFMHPSSWKPFSHPGKLLMMRFLKPWELQTLFQWFDNNQDGRIDVDELQSILRLVGIDHHRLELEKVFGDVSLDFENFAAICNAEEETGYEDSGSDEKELMEAFKVFDEDGDGFISSEELGRVLARLGLWKKENGDCMAMISKFDSNGDGRLDFDEFKDMLLRSL